MLVSAMTKSTDNVTLEILTIQDLESLKQKKLLSQGITQPQ